MQLTRCTLYKHMPTNVLSAFAIQLPLLTMLIYKARDLRSLLTRERTHAFSSTAAEKMKQTEREHRSHIMTYLKWLCVMDWNCVYQFTEYLMFYSVSNTFSSFMLNRILYHAIFCENKSLYISLSECLYWLLCVKPYACCFP